MRRDRRSRSGARAAEIHDEIVAMPEGYDTLSDREAALFRGVKPQRVLWQGQS